MTQPFGCHVRLRTRAEFTAVQNGGRRVSTSFFTLLGSPNTRETDRLGIIASRKIGGAVRRNRAKRRIREIFRAELSNQTPSQTKIGLAPYVDLVVIPRPTFVDAPFGALQHDFRSAVKKLRAVR